MPDIGPKTLENVEFDGSLRYTMGTNILNLQQARLTG
jgi:hypothetical protein